MDGVRIDLPLDFKKQITPITTGNFVVPAICFFNSNRNKHLFTPEKRYFEKRIGFKKTNQTKPFT
jgi:hypothetical protein